MNVMSYVVLPLLRSDCRCGLFMIGVVSSAMIDYQNVDRIIMENFKCLGKEISGLIAHVNFNVDEI